MTDTILNNNAILLSASQALKEQLINNLALAVSILNQGVTSRTMYNPPGSPPAEGAYIVASGGTGAWAGKDNNIALYYNGTLTFYNPYEGLVVWSIPDTSWVYYHNGSWNLYSGGSGGGGTQGSQGPQGPAGANGATWYSGSTIPNTTLGNNGDFYLNTTTDDIYNKVSGTWTLTLNIKGTSGTSGSNGTNGTNGSTWYSGSTTPTSGTGINGDYYFDTTTNDVYNKISGNWTAIANLTGATGLSGTNGTNGTTWYFGSATPLSGDGVNGDFYLNTNTDDVYNKSSNTWSIVTNLKGAAGSNATLPNINANTILGNNTSSSAQPIALTPTQVKSLLSIQASDVSGLNSLATSNYTVGTGANNLVQLDSSGKLPAVDGSQLTNISSGSIGNISAYSFLGNNTSAAASPIALNVTQAKNLLNIQASDITGLGSLATLSSVTNAYITSGTITLDRLAGITANSFLANNTGVTSAPTAINAAQAKAILNIQASDIAPSSTNNYVIGTVSGAVTWVDPTSIALGNIANNTVLGNVSGSSASPTSLSSNQIKTLLGLGSLATLGTINTNTVLGNVSGSAANPTSLSASQLSTLLGLGGLATLANSSNVGYVPTIQSNGSIAWDNPTIITAGSITLNDIATISNNTVLGNVSGSTASPIALSTNQLSTLLGLGSLASLSSLPLSNIAAISNNTVLGNVSGSSQTPSALSASQLSTLLGLGGLATLANSSNVGYVPTIQSNGSIAWDNPTTITAGSITLNDIATIGNNTFLGNVSGSTASPTALSVSQVSTALGLGNLATLSTISNNTVLGNISGNAASPTALSSSQLSTLLGLGSLATLGTIGNNTVLGNISGSSANPIALSSSQLSTLLGLGAIATLSNTGAVSGYVPTYQSNGTIAWAAQATIPSGSVGLSQMANLAANTILGNNTSSAATPIALTPTQVKSLLSIQASEVSGLAPIATLASVSNVGYVPTIQTGGSIAWAAIPTSSGTGWTVASIQTSTFTPVSQYIYPVNTSSAAISVTLPTTSGGLYWFVDAGGNTLSNGWASNNFTLVAPSGYTIQNGSSGGSLVLNKGNGFIMLTLIGTNFQILMAST